MMRLQIQEIEDPKIWDEFILSQNKSSLFQSYDWGQLQKSLGYYTTRFGYFAEDRLVAIAQIMLVRAKRGTYLHVRHGPVIDKTFVNNAQVWQEIKTHLILIARKYNAWFIRISPLLPEISLPQLKTLGFSDAPIHRMDGEVCWVLDLNKSAGILLSEMRKTTRYLIRQAEKIGVEIFESEKIEVLINLMDKTAKRQGFVMHEGIEKEFLIFKKADKAILLLAKYHEEILAGALILFWGDQAIYHHGGSLVTKIPASYLLQWKSIQIAKVRGARIYNFWGIAPDGKLRHPWQGITLFKKGFGGHEGRFIHAQDLPLSPFYWATYSLEWIRKVKKGY